MKQLYVFCFVFFSISMSYGSNATPCPNPPPTPEVNIIWGIICYAFYPASQSLLTVTYPLGDEYTYSIDGIYYQSSPYFLGVWNNQPFPITVTVKDENGCVSEPLVKESTDAEHSSVPMVSVTQLDCSENGQLGTISVTFPLNASFEYSIDGVNYQNSPVFYNVPLGSYGVTYRFMMSNPEICTSDPLEVTINPAPTVPTPQATLIPIICSFIPEDMGTLVVTYPLGDEYEYSIDGVIYQSSSVFPNAWPLGTFQLTVRQGDCISEPLEFSNIGQSTVPEAEIIQPDCSDVPESGQFGTISVTFPLGDEFQYSINGEDYQDSPFFNIVPPGSYELTFRLDEFCVSDPLEVIINDPVTALTPIVDIVQPTCDNPYGSITIEPFSLPWIWAQPEYSINGTDYYIDNVFENLPSGTYYVIVKLGNCISESLEVNIHFPPFIPENPTVNVIQPTCENPYGSIEVISPVDDGSEFIPNYEYSINGVDYYEFTVFDNLPAGNYYVTVRHLMSGCVSDSLEVILNAPDIPSPTVNIIQPTCDNPYGSIEVTSPVLYNEPIPPVTVYQYSINGTDYQDSVFFTNLSPGIYQVTAQQGYCISDPLEVIINALPEIAVNLMTICENENRFLLKAETEENYQYLWNTGETTPEIEIDGTGIYSVTVSLDDCSKDFSISIDAIPCRIPKGISPNGDFINDEFDLSGYGTVNTVEVFNRYGKIVYSQSNYTNQWKGQSNNGKELPTGTYYYKVVFQNGETKTGWVYLNRE